MIQETMLRGKFTFWILDPNHPQKQYPDRQTPLYTFSTVKQFWQLFPYVKKPSKINEQSEYFIFKEGIKPLWEEPDNENGGYFKITLEKAKADKVYENAVIALICAGKQVNHCINGVRMRIKGDNFMLEIWMNGKVVDNLAELKQYMKESLQISDQRTFGLLFPYKYKAKPKVEPGKEESKEGPKQTKESHKEVFKEREQRQEWKNGGGTRQSKNRSFNR